jgi:hypothetical protein
MMPTYREVASAQGSGRCNDVEVGVDGECSESFGLALGKSNALLLEHSTRLGHLLACGLGGTTESGDVLVAIGIASILELGTGSEGQESRGDERFELHLVSLR